MRTIGWGAAISLAMSVVTVAGNTETDPAHKYAWGENVGWANAGPTNHEVTAHYYEGSGGWLSGHAWSENTGWVVMGNLGGGPYVNTTSSNWGVNLAANGDLSGYAWGENVGWINFGHAQCDAAIDRSSGELSGHAWGENVGWLRFRGVSPDYGVRTRAFDTQAQGTPNWWLDHHDVGEDHDAGDGVAAWRKYAMDTDPTVVGDYLRITAISRTLTRVDVTFTPASTRRRYTLTGRESLTEGDWSDAAPGVQYAAPGEKTMQDTNAAAHAFYSVEVTVAP